MLVNGFFFWMAKRYLNRSGKINLAQKPDFHEYDKRLDIPSSEGASDPYCYDIIYAKKENRKGIALLDIHGGAYVYSTRRHNHTFMNYFLERGFDVVIFDYPLNKGKFGADEQFRAIYQEVAHFNAHKKEYGLDEELWIIGDSAGGHYALLLAEALTNPKARERMNLESLDLDIKGVLLNCPVYDFTATATMPGLTKHVRRQMWGPRFVDQDYLATYDPRAYYSEFDLPVFLSSCKQDFIGTNSAALAEGAKVYGKNLTYCYLDTDAKGVDHVHNVVRLDLPESKQVNDAMIDFINSSSR